MGFEGPEAPVENAASMLRDEAVTAGSLVTAADPLSIRESKRPDAHAIVDAFIVEIGTLDVRVELAKDGREFHLQGAICRFRSPFRFL